MNFGLRLGVNFGLIDGVNLGFSEGVNLGLIDGVNFGFSEGVNFGFMEGVNFGLIEGVNWGFSDGVNFGFRLAGICENALMGRRIERTSAAKVFIFLANVQGEPRRQVARSPAPAGGVTLAGVGSTALLGSFLYSGCLARC